MIGYRRYRACCPLVLRQGEHRKRSSRVAHKAPRVGGNVPTLVYRRSGPETLLSILVADQPGETVFELGIVTGYACLLQGKRDKASGEAVAFAFHGGPILSYPHIRERLNTPTVPLPTD